jgi:uncharacterized protein YndB with AHSA1/START domain
MTTMTNSPRHTLTLVGDLEMTLVREFNAPRELVFRLYTDPSLISQWWGPRDIPTEVDYMDARTGGSWRYISTGRDGEKFGFRGEYREVVPPEKIVQTFEWEPLAGHISVDTTTFEELEGGRTRMHIHSVFPSREDRDGMIASGMEGGWSESMERLDEVLDSLKA